MLAAGQALAGNPHPEGSKRLPPNPRRRKVPLQQRKRTVKACNACNTRRVKCSGTQPCTQCESRSRACEFPSDEEKMIVRKDEYESLKEQCLMLQNCISSLVPDEGKRMALLAKWSLPHMTSSLTTKTSDLNVEDRDEEISGDGRILQDPDGYTKYLGGTSGAAFMDGIREFVGTILHLLSDSPQLAQVNVEATFASLLDAFYLPPVEQISKMISIFRIYAQDGYGLSESGGIYYWGDLTELEERYRDEMTFAAARQDFAMLCDLNVVMALACQYDPSLDLSWEGYPGEQYFARAKCLLVSPMENATLANMRALCLMGQYLLGIYRRDAAYIYIGLAARISVINGLHKGWMTNGQGPAGEQKKREFWNMLILDRWLSCLTGRPAMIPQDIVAVQLPIDFADGNLPPSGGLREHAKLAMIMDAIMNTLYETPGTDFQHSRGLSQVNIALEKLSHWQAELPLSLKLKNDDEITDRATLSLHMKYHQLIILCTRPFLFMAVKKAVAATYVSSSQTTQIAPNHAHIECCVKAARENSKLISQLQYSHQTALLDVTDYHFPFNAAIVLQLARLLPETTLPSDSDRLTLLTELLRTAGDSGNESSRDCLNMTVEFGAVVTKLLLNSYERQASNCSTTKLSPMLLLASSAQNLEGEINNISGAQSLPSLGDTPVSSTSQNSGFMLEGQSVVYDELFSWLSEPFMVPGNSEIS